MKTNKSRIAVTISMPQDMAEEYESMASLQEQLASHYLQNDKKSSA
jgi:hypothetical protein